MFLQPLVVYSLAFLLGFGTIGWGYLLQKRFRLRFLSDYFIYLLAAVTYGFFNWIGPFLVSSLGRGLEERAYIFIVLIFGTLGIPLLLVKIFFLLSLVIHWIGRGISGIVKGVFSLYAAVTFLLFFLDAFAFFRHGRITPGQGNIFYIGVFSIGIQFIILLIPLLPSREGFRPPPSLRIFSVTNLVCYGLYTAAAYTDFLGMTPLVYYLCLLPPLIFVWYEFRRNPPPQPAETALDVSSAYAEYDLTPREREIVDLILLGRNNRQVGKQLHLSTQSVKNALTRVYRKAGVSSRSELISRLMRLDRLG